MSDEQLTEQTVAEQTVAEQTVAEQTVVLPGDEEQPNLIDVDPDWKTHWRGMPSYVHDDLQPWQTIQVHFQTQADRQAFANIVGQQLHAKTKFIWHPKAEIRRAADKVYARSDKVTPRYPVYVISKGRWESRLTSKALEWIDVPYHIVIEPQEYEQYAAVVDPKKILVLPFSNLGLGGIPARNWVWEHAIATGAERHWILDDNISGFCRFQDNLKVEVDSGATFCAVEDFVDRYENVAMAAFNYDYFAPRKQGAKIKPITWNTRCYSGILLSNTIQHRWRGRYNEDTDLSLCILKDDWTPNAGGRYCTVLFNALLMYKKPTLTMKGGNTDELYNGVDATMEQWIAHAKACKDGCKPDENPRCQAGRDVLSKDGRWLMAESLRDQHPDLVSVERKWDRWQHQVDYRRFRYNKPISKENSDVVPEGDDEYGMELAAMPGELGHDARNAAMGASGVSLGLTPAGRQTASTQAAGRPGLPPSPVSALDFVRGQLEAGLVESEPALRPGAAGPGSLPGGKVEASASTRTPFLGHPGQPDGQPGVEAATAPAIMADLASRGHRLLTRDGRLFATEANRLTDDDRATMKQHKDALIVLAAPWPSVPATTVSLLQPSRSLAQFLGSEGMQLHDDWQPDEPPDLAGIDSITLNFEATGYRWWDGDRPIGVTIGTLDGQLKRFLPWGFAGGNLDEATMIRYLQREVRGKHITNANTRFEVHMGRNIGVDFEEQGCTVSDVQHYAALLDDNRRKFNIDLLAEEFLGGVKVPRVDESRMQTYHAQDVAERALYQVQLVAELRAVMWPKLNAEDLQKIRQLEDDVIYPVCEMERNGVPLDVELLDRWVKESAAQYEACILALYKETGQQINPNAPTDLEKLFNHLNLPITRLESGAPSFTDDILKRITHPLIKQLRFAIKLSDLRSRYLLKYQKVVGGDGILRYALHQTRYQKDSGEEGGTGPGRFSSSELDQGVGVNIQQVIKVTKQRKMFGYDERDASHDDEIYLIRRLAVPRDGSWLSADAMQIEYRMFAHYAANPKVVQAYKDDPLLNFHAFTQQLMVRHRAMSYDDSKTYNFATIYGAFQVKQATMLGFITEEEAAWIREQKAWNDQRLMPMKAVTAIYDRELPEVKPLLNRAAGLAASRGYIKTLLGRRSRFTTDKRFHKALNNCLQGGAADYMKIKLVEVHRERKHTGLLLRTTVHDELGGDARLPETLERVRAILDRQSWPEMKVPLLWDAKVGANWADAK